LDVFDGQAAKLDEGPGLLQSAWRYKGIVAIAALVGALLGYAYEARQPTLYEGVTQLLLSQGANTGSGNGGANDPQRFLSNQVAKIGSWPVMELAAKEVPGTSPALLSQQVSTEISKDADVITIRVLAPTGEEAAQLAKAVGTAYDEFIRQSSRDQVIAERKQLEAAMRDLSATFAKLETAIAASPGDRSSLEARKLAVQEQQTATARRIQQLASQPKDGTGFVDQQQDGPVPQRPVQPKPSRGAAAGLLLGLVGSTAVAWWLNTRKMARTGRAAAEQVPGAAGADEGQPPEWDRAPEGRVAGRWSDTDDAAGNGNGNQRRGGNATLNRWLTGRRPGDPNEVESNGATLQGRPAPATSPPLNSRRGAVNASLGPGASDLGGMFARVAATLSDEPVDWFLDNLPQRMAEQVIMRVYADVVTLLLDDAEGAFELAGSIGLTAEEEGVAVDIGNEILREALRQGASVFQDTNPVPPAAVDIPGGRNAEALVLVPLVESSSWLGMLLVGRRRPASGSRNVTFSDEDIERIILYAMEIAPTLQALLLLGRLQSPLRSLDDPEERAERTADFS
jgi:capsular polysaccharide biosynthesis protein